MYRFRRSQNTIRFSKSGNKTEHALFFFFLGIRSSFMSNEVQRFTFEFLWKFGFENHFQYLKQYSGTRCYY